MQHHWAWLGAVAGLLAVCPVTLADELFSTATVQFDLDTIVEFEFVQSNGVYQSTFGVLNVATGERVPLLAEVRSSDDNGQAIRLETDLGSPGVTVVQSLAEFRFIAGTPYSFYLESSYNGQPAGIIYSTNVQNPGGSPRVVFEGGLTELAAGGVMLRWDDTGSLLVDPPQQDRDFDDFLVRAGGQLVCP